MNASDRRMIEDYVPIREISIEAAKEKTPQAGYPATLHLWWARLPLIACRAAVYSCLVNAPQNSNGRGGKSRFISELCRNPVDKSKVETARQHILEAHTSRLLTNYKRHSTEIAKENPLPRILDQFAGGGSIPLEIARLGCETYSLELNPVAHLIELCTLVYPNKYGANDRDTYGSSNDGSWAGLAAEIRHWGKWVYQNTMNEVGELYPPIPGQMQNRSLTQKTKSDGNRQLLRPVAYIWTRIVVCKNPACRVDVPLVRQTWLYRKKGNYIAMRVTSSAQNYQPLFSIVVSNAPTEQQAISEFGFNPSVFSSGGNAVCFSCPTVADETYIKQQGQAGRIRRQLMAVVCTSPTKRGKIYISGENWDKLVPSDEYCEKRLHQLCDDNQITKPSEPLPPYGSLGFRVQPYGYTKWGDLFTPRQLLSLLTFVKYIRIAYIEMLRNKMDEDHAKAVTTYLASSLSRLVDYNSSFTMWNPAPSAGMPAHTFGRNALQMVWDFTETNPFGGLTGDWMRSIDLTCKAIPNCMVTEIVPEVVRGNALSLPYKDDFFDAIITDPPYYDNVPYSDLSDFFYVWLKRSIGNLYPDHFASELTPKRHEIVSEPHRYGGKDKAKSAYEEMIAKSFSEARRVLKENAPMVVVYAHKTTAGWSTLVDALRRSGFLITQAWPLSTQKPGRLRAQKSAALASSIFMVAKRRGNTGIGSYEKQVRPLLESIVRERVDFFWKRGISGADLVMAAVGAGLRAYTLFERVEYENGEEVPSDKFILEVEGLVLDTILENLGLPKAGVAAVDKNTRFYILWRFTYEQLIIDAGEAIVFAYPQGVELDGPKGLSTGQRALLEKEGGKYRLRSYAERGLDDRLGAISETGEPSPLIDSLHRILWLMENQPNKLSEFLDKSRPNKEELRLVAQALQGQVLRGPQEELIHGSASERAALEKLLAHWRTLIEEKIYWGQKKLSLGEFTEEGD